MKSRGVANRHVSWAAKIASGNSSSGSGTPYNSNTNDHYSSPYTYDPKHNTYTYNHPKANTLMNRAIVLTATAAVMYVLWPTRGRTSAHHYYVESDGMLAGMLLMGDDGTVCPSNRPLDTAVAESAASSTATTTAIGYYYATQTPIVGLRRGANPADDASSSSLTTTPFAATPNPIASMVKYGPKPRLEYITDGHNDDLCLAGGGDSGGGGGGGGRSKHRVRGTTPNSQHRAIFPQCRYALATTTPAKAANDNHQDLSSSSSTTAANTTTTTIFSLFNTPSNEWRMLPKAVQQRVGLKVLKMLLTHRGCDESFDGWSLPSLPMVSGGAGEGGVEGGGGAAAGGDALNNLRDEAEAAINNKGDGAKKKPPIIITPLQPHQGHAPPMMQTLYEELMDLVRQEHKSELTVLQLGGLVGSGGGSSSSDDQHHHQQEGLSAGLALSATFSWPQFITEYLLSAMAALPKVPAAKLDSSDEKKRRGGGAQPPQLRVSVMGVAAIDRTVVGARSAWDRHEFYSTSPSSSDASAAGSNGIVVASVAHCPIDAVRPLPPPTDDTPSSSSHRCPIPTTHLTAWVPSYTYNLVLIDDWHTLLPTTNEGMMITDGMRRGNVDGGGGGGGVSARKSKGASSSSSSSSSSTKRPPAIPLSNADLQYVCAQIKDILRATKVGGSVWLGHISDYRVVNYLSQTCSMDAEEAEVCRREAGDDASSSSLSSLPKRFSVSLTKVRERAWLHRVGVPQEYLAKNPVSFIWRKLPKEEGEVGGMPKGGVGEGDGSAADNGGVRKIKKGAMRLA